MLPSACNVEVRGRMLVLWHPSVLKLTVLVCQHLPACTSAAVCARRGGGKRGGHTGHSACQTKRLPVCSSVAVCACGEKERAWTEKEREGESHLEAVDGEDVHLAAARAHTARQQVLELGPQQRHLHMHQQRVCIVFIPGHLTVFRGCRAPMQTEQAVLDAGVMAQLVLQALSSSGLKGPWPMQPPLFPSQLCSCLICSAHALTPSSCLVCSTHALAPWSYTQPCWPMAMLPHTSGLEMRPQMYGKHILHSVIPTITAAAPLALGQ